MAEVAGDAEIAVTPQEQPRPSRPIAIYLFVLALVALVPAFVFSAILLQRNNQAQERVVESLITGTSRSIVQAVEREITANITTLKVLATTPALLAGDLASFHDRVRTALEGTGTSVYLLDRDFVSLMSTRVDYPTPPTQSSDPETAQKALAANDAVVSDLVLGRVSQRWVFNILLPIYPATNGPMILGLTRDAEDLAGALLSNKLPDGWNVVLVDGKGVIVAGTPGAGNSGQPFTQLQIEDLSAAPGWTEMQSGNQPTVVAVQRSFLTNWTLVAWAPRDIVARPLADAFWSLLVGGLLLATLVILVIYWVSLQIGRSVHRLEDDAKMLGAGEAVPARDYPISEIATVSHALSEASRRRRAADIEVRFLMRELAHRSKNQMTVIAAMAKQTAKGADTVPEFVSSFEKRIFGLARSTDLLLANGAVGVDLEELLSRQIDPFCPVDGDRVTLNGPPMRLNMQSAQIIGMAAHELATNAVKYGAFSTETGTLHVAWSRGSDRVHFLWRETVAFLPKRTARRGFGTTVLENMVGRSLGAEVRSIVHADGIEWSFDIPTEALDPAKDPHGRTEVDETPEPANPAPQAPVAATGEEK
jgi:two-component sensor histidine kinase